MNGYTIMADGYRKLLKNGEVSESEARTQIKVLDFLASCEESEIAALFDSTAFNEIVKEYVNQAIRQSDLGEDIRRQIMNSLNVVLSERTASDILRGNRS